MAETTVENQVCRACGADVREGALFCYHCGGAVASEIAVTKTDNKEALNKIEFSKNDNRENGFEPKLQEVEIKQKDAEISSADAMENPLVKPNLQSGAKLESAAAMRGKSKLVQAQKVEVIWEERESTPDARFILAALVLTLLAAVILFLAIRLK